MTFNISGWQGVTFAIQIVLPLLVGLVTTKVTSKNLKSLLLTVLSLVTAGGAQALQAHAAGQAFDAGQALLTAAAGLAISLGAHYVVWKPNGVTNIVQASLITAKTPTADTSTASGILSDLRSFAPAKTFPTAAVDAATDTVTEAPAVPEAPAVSVDVTPVYEAPAAPAAAVPEVAVPIALAAPAPEAVPAAPAV